MNAERWSNGPLGDVAHVEMGQSPLSEFVSDQPERGAPFLQGNAEFTDRFPRSRLWCARPPKMARKGDALISVRAPVGALNRADRDYCIGRGLAAVRFTGMDANFGYHALARFSVALRQVAQGTTFEAVGGQQLRELALPCCPEPEQRRIAEILDTLDEAIRSTELVIDKLQLTKQGLLHDLLTRGLDANGELRNPERYPKQFKDSSLGQIPCSWMVCAVQNLLADVVPAIRSGPFGSGLLKSELVSEGVPLLGIDNVHVERFVADYVRFVPPQKAAELSRYLVRPRDVMITIMGTVGRCCVVPDDVGEALSSKHVWTLTFDQRLYSPFLACVQFNYAPWVLSHLARDEQGGIMSAIRSETLRTTMLPVPPRHEQEAIESILSESQKRLDAENLNAEKLKSIKKGLADDLLSGRIRVPVPDEKIAA